jgi:hypothetical protein
MTFRNLNLGDLINPAIHKVEDPQAAAIKKFLKKGKPVLLAFGPSVRPPRARMDPESGSPDGVEKLLTELGVQMGKTVVLYDAEATAFAGQGADQAQVLGANVSVPPVEFEWAKGDTWPLRKPDAVEPPPNPIRRSMVLAENSIAKRLDLPVRYPRPVYYEPPDGHVPKFAPEIMMTAASAWNESQPFPTDERTPRFEEPKQDDPATGTRDEMRHGRFSIGVAVEAPLPGSWFESGEKNPGDVRLVVYGQGGAAQNQGSLLTGDQLSPGAGEAAVDDLQLAAGPNDRLPNAERPPWSFPRQSRWSKIFCGGRRAGGLPAVFLYLGLVVLMVRRMR